MYLLHRICEKIEADELGSYLEYLGDDIIRFQFLFLDDHESVSVNMTTEELKA